VATPENRKDAKHKSILTPAKRIDLRAANKKSNRKKSSTSRRF
jgi:hypothetical protein